MRLADHKPGGAAGGTASQLGSQARFPVALGLTLHVPNLFPPGGEGIWGGGC